MLELLLFFFLEILNNFHDIFIETRATKNSSANHKIYKILHHKIYLEEQKKNFSLENRRFMENLIIV